ncbi:MAG: peptidylprolyl isomerase [Alphaproteobacteria bacterium]|nr:peptidylprolyl isomerase [Alphaproteobacteria bacterium]MBN2675078.1 peptidylprolyl isomerase [Alphaproteobacteria bacterium]
MLEYLRDMSGKPVAKILIGILMFSFVGWGVAEWVLSNTSREGTLIKVGDTVITPGQFNNEKTREMARLSRPEQKRIYTEPEYANAFLENVIKDLTNNAMVENRAADLGFIVTDKRVIHEIRMFPEFKDKKGAFSPELFMRLLDGSGFTEEQFADYLRSQILRSMVLGSMSVPVKVPDFEVKVAYNARYGEKVIDYTEVKFSDFKIENPTEKSLREFYNNNPKMIPESRVVSYVLVPAKMDKPDSYDAGYTNAQKLEDEIISGESMAAAAKKVNAKFVLLPSFSKEKRPTNQLLTDSIVSKIFSMEQGLESEIMETKQGFVIMRVEKINSEYAADFKSVKDSLVSSWKAEEQKKKAYLKANDLLITLNKTKVLKDKKTTTISRMKGAPTDVLVAAYSTGAVNNAIVPSKNAFYVLHIVKEIEPKVDNAKMATMRKEIQSIKTRQVLADYNAFLIREYPVKVNEKAFQKLFGRK